MIKALLPHPWKCSRPGLGAAWGRRSCANLSQPSPLQDLIIPGLRDSAACSHFQFNFPEPYESRAPNQHGVRVMILEAFFQCVRSDQDGKCISYPPTPENRDKSRGSVRLLGISCNLIRNLPAGSPSTQRSAGINAVIN